ncbi:MAG: ATPase [Alphaproteobacteria bacterium]|nr:ATPase [Alphaproteobacteria bacterium]
MKPAKRFWKKVAVAEGEGGGFAILLDGKPLKTPAGRVYAVPFAALAEAVAAEWDAVEQVIEPHNMPLTQLCATAQDIVPGQRAQIIEQLTAYAGADLLCYRALEPTDLAERQNARWQPLLDWAAARFGATLQTTQGIGHIKQDKNTIKVLGDEVKRLDDIGLAALQLGVSVSGSLITGLALLERHISADAAFAVAEMDASYQIEKWGLDPEAAKRRETVLADLKAVERLAATLPARR